MVQATLSDEMEFLKAHTNKLRKVTERCSPDIASHSHFQTQPPSNPLCVFLQQFLRKHQGAHSGNSATWVVQLNLALFSNSYAARVESQVKLIQTLEAQVRDLDPEWGKRKQGPIVTDMYDHDESRH